MFLRALATHAAQGVAASVPGKMAFFVLMECITAKSAVKVYASAVDIVVLKRQVTSARNVSES